MILQLTFISIIHLQFAKTTTITCLNESQSMASGACKLPNGNIVNNIPKLQFEPATCPVPGTDWFCGGTLTPCGVNCYCDVTVDGIDICWNNGRCDEYPQTIPCNSDRGCPQNTACVTSCCGQTCILECLNPFTFNPTIDPTNNPASGGSSGSSSSSSSGSSSGSGSGSGSDTGSVDSSENVESVDVNAIPSASNEGVDGVEDADADAMANGANNVSDMFGIKDATAAETYSILAVIIIAGIVTLVVLTCGVYQYGQKRKALDGLNQIEENQNNNERDSNIDEKPFYDHETEVVTQTRPMC